MLNFQTIQCQSAGTCMLLLDIMSVWDLGHTVYTSAQAAPVSEAARGGCVGFRAAHCKA